MTEDVTLAQDLAAVTAVVSRRFLLSHDLWERGKVPGRVAPRWVAWEVLGQLGHTGMSLSRALGWSHATICQGSKRVQENPTLREEVRITLGLLAGDRSGKTPTTLAYRCWQPLIPLVPWQELDDVLAYLLADLLEIAPAESAARARGLCTLARAPEAVRALTLILQAGDHVRARSLLQLQVAALQSPRRR